MKRGAIMRKKGLIIFLLMQLFISYTKIDAQEGAQKMGALTVNIYKIQPPKNISFELQYPARIKSISRVTVVARVSGILKEIFFKEGQYVKRDAPLFKIEPERYQAEYDNAKAQLDQAIAELNRAERDWQRIKASFEERLVSEQQRDAALSAYEQAKALVEAAKARLKDASLNLQYTDVKAPLSGITGTKLVDIGNLVNPNTALVTITEIDPVYVEFSIPDTDLMRLKAEGLRFQASGDRDIEGSGLKKLQPSAYLMIENRPYKHKGNIDFIDSAIDEKTSSVNARAVFPNPERQLYPGEFVRIVIRGLKREALVVPQKAVLQSPTGPFVYVVENGRAIPRNIKLGERAGEDFIVEEGLKSGELVIVDNLMKLRPEMPVKIGEEVKR
ncbi:MAG: efflux RND transporter periplasmic adaptor subunit [Thermodesulfovibrionia bacterium]